MTSLSNLTPTKVWKHFEEICSIPHPSKYEDKILAHIISFAIKHSLEYIQDEGKNIIIKKPATKGYETLEIVALQAHVDMVPQKNANKQHDFTTDPIIPYVDGDWVRAKDTTLGADNGIGLAAILALLESTDIPHGPLEALLTTDEEAGMNGANLLSPKSLKAKFMINTDTEDEHDITVGCAGGIDGNFYFDIETTKPSNTEISYSISISGLTGGHSGFEIILERANANVILTDFLSIALKKFNANISEIHGGNMRNAIPREGNALFTIPKKRIDEFELFCLQFVSQLKAIFSKTDPLLHCTITETSKVEKVIIQEQAYSILQALKNCPNGVISFEKGFDKLVKTSTNLSIIKTTSKQIEVYCLLRSSDTTEKMLLANSMQQNFKLFGGTSQFLGDYPSWKPVWESEILSLVTRGYKEFTSITPEVKVVHAGLECGIFSGKYPSMEFISIGPNIRGPHSPDERVEIRTVEQFWNILLYVLKNIPHKK